MKSTPALHSLPALSSLLVVSTAAIAGVGIVSSEPITVAMAVLASLITIFVAYLAQKYSTSLTVFGAFLILLYAGSRDFAYLAIEVGRVRVFVAEIVLVVMWVSLVPQ